MGIAASISSACQKCDECIIAPSTKCFCLVNANFYNDLSLNFLEPCTQMNHGLKQWIQWSFMKWKYRNSNLVVNFL